MVKYRKCFISVCNNVAIELALLWYLTKTESTEKKYKRTHTVEWSIKLNRREKKKVELWRNGSLRFIDTWWTRFIFRFLLHRSAPSQMNFSSDSVRFCCSGAIKITSFIVASLRVRCTQQLHYSLHPWMHVKISIWDENMKWKMALNSKSNGLRWLIAKH